MITARTDGSRSLIARLTQRARLLAEARAESRRRAIQRDPARWRRAALLWPNFARDI